jgi:hypothetical protein
VLRPAFAAAALLLLAGCSDPTEPILPAAGSQAFIDGVVVDVALRPLAGVSVAVAGSVPANATTVADGTFRLGPLPLGVHAVAVAKEGYISAQLTAEAQPDGSATALVKVVLEQLASARPYVETFQFEGYIECGTSSVAACAVPNFATLALCDTGGPCLGNVTNDRFNANYVPGGVPDWVQSELVWTPTVAASDRFYFSVSHYTVGEESELETVYNSTTGPSPLLLTVPGNATRDSALGLTEGYRQSVFSGAIDGTTPPGCAPPCVGPGFAVQQSFTVYTHFFYHYQPPPGWRFSQGEVPLPPLDGA